MITTSAELYGLQEIDLAIDGRQTRLAEISECLGTTEKLLEARESVAEGRRHSDTLRAQQKESEWEVNEVKGRARSVREKLYGGRIRNAKELQDLQADLKLTPVSGKRPGRNACWVFCWRSRRLVRILVRLRPRSLVLRRIGVGPRVNC